MTPSKATMVAEGPADEKIPVLDTDDMTITKLDDEASDEQKAAWIGSIVDQGLQLLGLDGYEGLKAVRKATEQALLGSDKTFTHKVFS